MLLPGHDVVILRSPFATPQVCARCDQAPATVPVRISKYNSLTRTTRSVSMPYCPPCAALRKRVRRQRVLIFFAFLVGTVLFAGLGAVLPQLPIAVLIAVPTALAVGTILAVLWLLGAKAKGPMALADAVWITSFSGSRTTFFCVSPAFAQRLAQGNETTTLSKKRSEKYVVGVSVLCGCVALAVSGYVAFSANPTVYFDNASADPLQIWLDGDKLLVGPPTVGLGARPSARLPYGPHDLGYSAPGSKKPRRVSHVQVEWSGNHLYNPGRTGCYWVDATVYGAARLDKDQPRGPQPIEEFYSFKRVDNWFASNPTSVSTKASGETRVAVQSLPLCGELSAQGCDLRTRQHFIDCARDAYEAESEEAFKHCVAKVSALCGGTDASRDN